MSDNDIYVKKFKDYLIENNKKGDFDKDRSKTVNEYIREKVKFDDKPSVVKALNAEYGDICNPEKIFTRTEIEIYLLKCLQSGEDISKKISREKLSEDFGYKSTRAFGNHLRKLDKEHDLLGNLIEIENLRHGNNTYDHTIHPVFLALNLTEVYFLTVILPSIANKFEKETALDIAGDIYRQLSCYAKEKIDHFINAKEKDNLLKRNRGYRKEKEDGVLDFNKHEWKCTLQLNDKKWYSGVIKRDKNNSYIIINDITGESRVFNLEDVVSGPLRIKSNKKH